MSRKQKILSWIARGLVGALFTMAGVGKLIAPEPTAGQFAGWGYAPGFAIAIGLIEAAGGIGLLFPRLVKLAAYALLIVMAGAFLTHVRAGEWTRLWIPGVLMLALGWFARSAPDRANF